MKPVTNAPTVYGISLAEAQGYIKEYKSFMMGHFKQSSDTILKAYLIHAGELLEALGIEDAKPRYPYVRVYIGKQLGEQVTDMKLFITPVDEGQNDIILKKQLSKFGPLEDVVLDLNAPCPNACDRRSPLFNA